MQDGAALASRVLQIGFSGLGLGRRVLLHVAPAGALCMPDDVMIDVRGVSKHFGRRHRITALRDVSLQIPRGRVTAVVGPNGAGKSTLFGLILGFLRPSAGEVSIEGDDPRHYVLDHGIGYLPDRFALPAGWPVRSALVALGTHAGVARDRAAASLEDFGLAEYGARPFGKLSRGLMQRVGLAHALSAGRELLVLDEPAEGLDPIWRVRLRERIAAERDRGRTVLIASHDLNEVGIIADRVIVLDRGAVKDIIDTDVTRAQTTYRIVVAVPHDERVPLVFPGATAATDGSYTVTVADPEDLTARIAALIDMRVTLVSISPSPAIDERLLNVVQP